MFRLPLMSLLAFASFITFTGCGGGKPVPVATKGIVKLDGQPMPKASVEFHPLDANGKVTTKPPAVGVTNEQGEFELSTPGEDIKGALPGTYKVAVTAIIGQEATGGFPGGDMTKPPPKPKIDPKYTEVNNSPLATVTIPASAPIVLEVKSPGK